MKIYEIVLATGKNAKVKTGLYGTEQKAHSHLMELGAECERRLDVEADENGCYILRSKSCLPMVDDSFAICLIKEVLIR